MEDARSFGPGDYEQININDWSSNTDSEPDELGIDDKEDEEIDDKEDEENE